MAPTPTIYNVRSARRRYVQCVDFLIVLHTVSRGLMDGHHLLRNPTKPPEKVADVLNVYAPMLSATLVGAMDNEIVLAICRLTDPKQKQSGKFLNESLTLERLADDLPAIADRKERAEFAKLVKSLGPKTRSIAKVRKVRNKFVGHSDLAYVLGQKRGPRMSDREIDKIVTTFIYRHCLRCGGSLTPAPAPDATGRTTTA